MKEKYMRKIKKIINFFIFTVVKIKCIDFMTVMSFFQIAKYSAHGAGFDAPYWGKGGVTNMAI